MTTRQYFSQNLDELTYSIKGTFNAADFKSWLMVPTRYSSADFRYSLYHSSKISLLSTHVVHLEVIGFLCEGIFILSPSAFRTNDIFGREWDYLVLPIYHRYICSAIAYSNIFQCFHYMKIITQYPVP